jgi:hypothetical protein
MRFLLRWTDWVLLLLSTTSTQVMLNGSPASKICHGCGLRQGDPLSPMLFLLVMEVLSTLFCKANDWLLLWELGARGIPLWASLYADDVILFLSLVPRDLWLTCTIIDLFQGAPGLACNLGKCQLTPIHCDDAQVKVAKANFPCSVVDFRVKYLVSPS